MSKKGVFYRPRARGREKTITVFDIDLYDQWIEIIYDYSKNSYNIRGAFRREKDADEVERAVTTVISFYRKAINITTQSNDSNSI
jgi:hypothetical protein